MMPTIWHAQEATVPSFSSLIQTSWLKTRTPPWGYCKAGLLVCNFGTSTLKLENSTISQVEASNA